MVHRRSPEPDQVEVVVELAEATQRDVVPATGPDADGAGVGVPDAPTRRRGRLLATGLAVALVLVVGAAQVAESGRSPTRGVVTGRIGSVPVAPTELWRADSTYWSIVADGVVTHGMSEGGLVLRDLRTGEVLAERTRDDVGYCDRVGTTASSRTTVHTHVLCTRDDLEADGALAVLTAVSTRDASTLWRHSAPTTGWSSMAQPIPGDDRDVLWSLAADEGVRLVRLAHDDGTVRWTADVRAQDPHQHWVHVGTDVVAVGDTQFVDVETGRTAAGASMSDVWAGSLDVPVPRGVGRYTYTESSTELAVLDEDGTERFVVEGGYPTGWEPLVSDAAREVVVALPDGAVAVLDVLTGGELWRPETPETPEPLAVEAVAYLPGVLVVADGEHLRGVVPRTGAEQWSVRRDPSIWPVAVADERRLVLSGLVGPEDDTLPFPRRGLVAVDLGTGEVVWELPVLGAVHAITGADDVVLVQTESTTLAFATR